MCVYSIYQPGVEVNLSESSSSSTLFIRSTIVNPDGATKIKSIREPVNDVLEFPSARTEKMSEW